MDIISSTGDESQTLSSLKVNERMERSVDNTF